MKAIKRIIALILISIFVIGAVFISYTGIKNGAVVYATVNDDSIYVPLRSESDAVKCFQAYCKSRDLTIEGSLSDAVTTFTTGAFNSACNELGIDITELQAELKAEYDQSGEPVKFFLNDTGVMAMNRIFAQFLQDNELQVGDADVDKTIYSGMVFTDNNGINSLVTFYDANDSDKVTAMGTAYHAYDGWYAVNDVSYPTNTQYPFVKLSGFNFNYVDNKSHTFIIEKLAVSDEVYRYRGSIDNLSASNFWLYNNGNTGMFSVLYNIRTSDYYIGYVNLTTNKVGGTKIKITPNNGQSQQTNIIIVAPTINNNNYEGDTIINNEGDIINNNPDNPDQPDFPDYPEEPTGNVDDWGAEMPDLNIPWYLQGKEDKFPWNIPFNIMLTLSLLKAEPQAPHFEGTMDFKFTTYDYEIDLSQFDDVAEVLRKMEVIAFLIGLMVLTRNLIGW